MPPISRASTQFVSLPTSPQGVQSRTVWNVRPAVLKPNGPLVFVAGTLERRDNNLASLAVYLLPQKGGANAKKRIELATIRTDQGLVPYHEFQAFAVADVTGKKAPDVFVTAGGVSYRLRNDGSGGFGAPTRLPGRLENMTSGRVTRTDRDQLVAFDATDHAIKLMTFKPDGAVESTRTLTTLDPNASSPVFDGMVIADLNGDRRPDIAVTGADIALLQDAQGNFRQVPLGTETAINGTISAGDIDGDNIPELAITDATMLIDFPGRVRVFKGTPEQGYRKLFDGSAGDNHPQSVLLTDVTGDRRADVVLPGFDTGDVFLYRSSAGTVQDSMESVHIRPQPDVYGGSFYVREVPGAPGRARQVVTTAEDGVTVVSW